MGPFDPAADALWRDMQAGLISERDYWDRRAEEIFPDDDDPVWGMMNVLFAPPGHEVVRPEMMELLVDVERPAVLTNDLSRFHGSDWLASMALEGVFDPLIDLSYMGVLKPAPGAYAHACEVLGASPQDVLFVDDQPNNIAGAEAYGLRVVWFDVTDPGESVLRIRKELE
jgi:putative hydrolase of the HAD superfamily